MQAVDGEQPHLTSPSPSLAATAFQNLGQHVEQRKEREAPLHTHAVHSWLILLANCLLLLRIRLWEGVVESARDGCGDAAGLDAIACVNDHDGDLAHRTGSNA